MRFVVGSVLAALALTGCQTRVVDMHSHDALQPTERLGVESNKRMLSDGNYRVEIGTVASQLCNPDELAQLPQGAACTAYLKDSNRIIQGTVQQASGCELLVLDDANELIVGTHESGVPILEGVPYVNRLFKNTGIAMEERYLGSETISAAEILYCVVDQDTPATRPVNPVARRRTVPPGSAAEALIAAQLAAPAGAKPQEVQVDVADLGSPKPNVPSIERLNLSSMRPKGARPNDLPAKTGQPASSSEPVQHTASTVVAETFAVEPK